MKSDFSDSISLSFHAGVGAGMRAGCRPFVEDDKQRIERPADSNDNGDVSSGGSEHPGGFLSGNTSRPDPPSAQIDGVFGPRKTTRLCGVALSTRLLDLLGWIGDRLSLGPSVYVRIYNAFGNLCTAQHKFPVNITMRICRRFLVLALPVVIIATRDENDELSKLR